MLYEEPFRHARNSKKMLKRCLNIKDNRYLKQEFVSENISPYIDNKNGKKRLIECPSDDLKKIQKSIKSELAKLNFPRYVFSGVKKRSFVDNAKLHKGNKYLYKMDITAFFPSIGREKVFNFYKDKLCMPPDIAEILTNFTTIDLDDTKIKNKGEVDAFLKEKGVKTRNHLISGSPASQLLSYLANQDMFDSVHTLSNKNGIMMTLYVDDIIFSSPNRISANFIEIVENIISSQGYRLSKRKAKSHTKYYPKRVTGVIINKQGDISISNSIRKKTIDKCRQLKANPDDEQSRRELRGLVETARQVIPNAYPSIHKLAYDPNYKLSHMKQKPTPSIIKK